MMMEKFSAKVLLGMKLAVTDSEHVRIFNSGGGVPLADGNITSRDGSPVYVVLDEEGNIVVNRRNPNHNYPNEYIDQQTYDDEVLGEQYYWGNEYDLQETLAKREGEKYFINALALKLFSEDVLDGLIKASINFRYELSTGVI